MKSAKKQRGRPPKYKGERLSKTRTFRVRGNMDPYLAGAAHAAGRSISEEIEARLDRTFNYDALLQTHFGEAHPIIQALTAAVPFALASDLSKQDRNRALQVAAECIIAAFGGRPMNTNAERFRSRLQQIDAYELEGIKIAHFVMRSLGLEELAGPAEILNMIRGLDK
jgi:hypothetical protein